MNSCMRDPSAILQRERATLEWLQKQAAKCRIAPAGLYRAINNALLRMKDSVGMSVFLSWQVSHESAKNDLLWVYVGGNIKVVAGDITQLSYCLCVSEIASDRQKRHLLRKYHFDYANPSNTRRRPHPIFHIQYPGTLPAELATLLEDEHQDPYLDEPRVIYTPISLAMVLQMAFREFPEEFTERVQQDSYWRGILLKDETALLLPFYQECTRIIGEGQLVMDAAYGV